MKISSMVAVFAAALCVAGCRYDKAGAGAGDDAALNAGQGGSEIATDESANDSLSEIPLGDASENKFEDMYARCTDVDFAPVYFGFDSQVLPDGEASKADAVAQHLVAKPERVLVIEGNCDERGANEYNLNLGTSRAVTVRNYLIQSGIDGNRIQTRSYGEDKPAVDGHDESAWAQNRRDEFVIFDTTKKIR